MIAAINGIDRIESNTVIAKNLLNQIMKESSDGKIVKPYKE